MKLLAITLCCMLSMQLQAQQTKWVHNPEINNLDFVEVNQIDSATAKQLFSRAKTAIAKSFKNPDAVKRNEDEDALQIFGQGNMKAYISDPILKIKEAGRIEFSFTVQCKDGRYRLHVTDIRHSFKTQYGDISGGKISNEKPDCGGFKMTKKQWAVVKESAMRDIEAFAASFETFMQNKAASNNDNW